MEKLLQDKTILVVGAGGLLGLNLVTTSLKQGARIIAADINITVLKMRLKNSGLNLNSENLILKKLDLTNEISVRKLFDNIEHIDGAVNCTYPKNKQYGKKFFEVTQDSFNENLSLHLGSSFVFMKNCAMYFQKNKCPFSLVNISSVYGVIAPKFEMYDNTEMTMPVEYAAIKSALLHLNKYVASYIKDCRFRINCVSPGGIFDNQPNDFIQAYSTYTHGKGMLDVKDVLGAILFLLSDEAKYLFK